VASSPANIKKFFEKLRLSSRSRAPLSTLLKNGVFGLKTKVLVSKKQSFLVELQKANFFGQILKSKLFWRLKAVFLG